MLVGQSHPDDGADSRLQVLLGEPVERQLLLEGVEEDADRDRVEVEAGTTGQLGRVVDGVRRRPVARVARPRRRSTPPIASQAIAAASVESMPPESPSSTVRNPFLRT